MRQTLNQAGHIRTPVESGNARPLLPPLSPHSTAVVFASHRQDTEASHGPSGQRMSRDIAQTADAAGDAGRLSFSSDWLKSNFDKSWIGEPNSGCWLWLKSTHRSGAFDYGRARYRGGKIRAHRLSYLLHKGEIPDGLWVLHKCDTPLCVNPLHLFLGTQKDNNDDKMAKGRFGSKLTEDSVKAIRASSSPSRALGEQYGVTWSTICNVRNRKTWGRV